jgi:hypothetical protein
MSIINIILNGYPKRDKSTFTEGCFVLFDEKCFDCIQSIKRYSPSSKIIFAQESLASEVGKDNISSSEPHRCDIGSNRGDIVSQLKCLEHMMVNNDLYDVVLVQPSTRIMFDLHQALPVFQQVDKILAPCDRESEFSTSLIYIPDVQRIYLLNQYIHNKSYNQPVNNVLMHFSKSLPLLDRLPSVMSDYPYPIIPAMGMPVFDPNKYLMLSEALGGVFDCGAFGHFLFRNEDDLESVVRAHRLEIQKEDDGVEIVIGKRRWKLLSLIKYETPS